MHLITKVRSMESDATRRTMDSVSVLLKVRDWYELLLRTESGIFLNFYDLN